MRRELTWRERWFGRRPHSRDDELAETRELYDRVSVRYRSSRFTHYGHETLATLVAKVLVHNFGDRRGRVPPEMVGAARTLAAELIDMEPWLAFASEPAPALTGMDTAKGVAFRAWLRELERACDSSEELMSRWIGATAGAMEVIARSLPLDALSGHESEESLSLSVELADLLDEPGPTLNTVLYQFVEANGHGLFPRLVAKLNANIRRVSGIGDPCRSTKPLVYPSQQAAMRGGDMARSYFAGTPLLPILETPVPFAIPFSARFEHTHIVGGSGHGKTQLLQSLILNDISQLVKGRGSIVVIDSQGDMIRTIMSLAELSPSAGESLADRLVLIDPNDVEHPPALNLFDFGLERLERYGAVEREKLINGAIALYEYMFGALLGAELTQRQGVIFRYLARLMMVVPGATIHTLREFMEEPEATRPHLAKLDFNSRHFFETQFFSGAFDDTRQQILTRLWGVLSNAVLARMFSNPRNKLDLFEAMNRGSIILINTAKDLLKQEGCEILGRFFIAMISHAAQERASIPTDRRRATFVYVDEAQDYFDQSVELLLNQARKYKVGLVLAHQNLGQFEPRLMAAVMASTAIKIAGGVSAKDASALSKEMRCEPEFLQSMRKRHEHTEFACFIKNVTGQPVQLSVQFGQMEARPRMDEVELEELIERNRLRYGSSDDGAPTVSRKQTKPGGFVVSEPEVL